MLCNNPISIWIAILSAVLLVSACTPAPNLKGLEVSFSQGTIGSGATPPSRSLTSSSFGTRIRNAVETSPDLAQSNTRVEAALAGLSAAEGAFLPAFSLGLNARTERIDSDIADVSPYLRVSQLVYDGGAAAGTLAAAEATFFESQGDRLQTASATALRAVEAYVLVTNRRKLLTITQNNVSVHEDIEAQIKERTAAGAGSVADVLKARSRTADARTRHADAVARADQADARFREVFGTSPGELAPPVPAPLLTRSDTQIVLGSPQIRRADATLVAAKSELAAATARRLPEVRASAFANQDVDNDANFGLDLSVNYELDSTGIRRAQIATAQARVSEAEYSRDALIREISRELAFIRSDQKAGADRLREARTAAQTNAESVTAMQSQFRIGRRTLIEILDAQRDLVNAQERLIFAEQNFFLTNYAALSLTGDILDLLGISINSRSAQP